MFRFDIRKMLVVGFLLLLPLISINLQKPGEEFWILRPLSSLVGSTQAFFTGFTQVIRETTRRYIYLVGINQKLKDLEAQNKELKAKLLLLEEIQKENQRLNKMIGFQENTEIELLSAQVVGFDLNSERATIRINRGAKHQVEKGQAVITDEGVVGYTMEVHDATSIILLISDRYAVIDAIVQSSRARGIVEGSGPNECILKYLQRSDQVEVGDLVVTSGLDNIFPKGFPIGNVKLVEKQKSGVSQYVEIEPIVNIANLEEVFIVLSAKKYNETRISTLDSTGN